MREAEASAIRHDSTDDILHSRLLQARGLVREPVQVPVKVQEPVREPAQVPVREPVLVLEPVPVLVPEPELALEPAKHKQPATMELLSTA